MATAATLTILHLAERMIFQWHETQEGLPPVTVLATARADEALQSRIERAVQLLNTLLSQRQAVHPAAGQSGPAVSADEGQSPDPLQALGHLLFHQLLPTAIQSAVNALPTAIPLTIATNTTTLPWEIAHNDRGYLALHHVVSRQLLSDRLPPVRATRAGATWSALLIGNPTADLPHTTAEIEAVATLIEAMPGAAAPRILMQRRATKATVLQELAGGHYDLIHYAGHAQVQPDPAASGLLLAKGEILTAQELQQSLAGQPFVFLNGCESARAARQPFDPVHATATSTLEQPALHGLAHAFLMGGARGLLGTHWPIHDSTSQEFAVAFYRALLQGETLDVAVQQARRALQQRRPDDPLWAAFTLYAKAGDQLRQRPARIQRPGTILAIDLSRLLADYATEHGEDVSRQIDLVHSRLASTVARFGGRLLPMPTAQLLALFPATAAQNDAARAAQAAQAIRVNHLATEDKENTVGGIGISSGTLYWSTAANGDVTPSDAALAPVLGEPVQRALHLAQLHDAAILLDETAHQLLQRQTPPGALMTEPRGTTAPSAPPIFRLRALEARHRLAVAGAQPPGMDTHLPLVGRDHELTLLRTIWQKVSGSSPQRRGQGQLIGITGEAGIGKSRLVQGFATLLATDAVDPQPQWLSLRAPSTYQAAPYEIVVQLLRTLLNVPQLGGAVPRLANTMPSNSAGAWQVAGGNPHDSLHAIHHAQSASPSEAIEAPALAAKVAAATALDGPTLTAVLQSLPGMQPGAHLAEMAALLGELFDLPTEGATIAHLDLPTRQRRLAQLLGTLLAQRTQTTPLILWLDDLHLVDDSSLALLEQLAAGLDRLPILVLATFRADGTWQPPWWHRRNYQQIHLDALSDDATTELLCTLLESEQLPNALQALFVERSGGHPLFVQELVTSLAEAGALVRGAAGWQLHGAQHDAQVPGTIQRVLLSRIDSLPEQAQRVLTVAATIGDPADPALLRAALEPTLQADALEQALTTLETRNLLYQPWGSMAYHFHHSLLRDVAYAGMALEERRRTHRRLAELLESTLRSEPTEVEQLPILAQLAHHYFHSVVTPTATGSVRIATDTPLAARQRAAHYLQQAGERAHQKYAARSAIQHYQRALDLVATLPDATAHRPALLDRLGAAHEIVTEFPQAIATLRQLHEHYVAHPATVSPAIQAELARRIGRLYERQSDYATALTWIERGLALLAIADQEEDSHAERLAAAALQVRLGCVRYSQGDHSAAAAACEEGLQLTADLAAGAVQAEAHNLLGSIADLQGATAAAGDHYRAALAIYQALGNAYEVARVENNLALVCFRSGAWEEAKAHFQRGITFWEEIEDHYNLAFNRLNLGVLEMYQGNWEDAAAGFQQALSIWRAANNQRWCALCYTNLGLLAIEQQQWQEAHAHLTESRALIMQQGIHHFLPEVTYALGEVALGQGDYAGALALAQEAVEQARTLAMKLEEALALRTQGKAALALADLAGATRALDASLQLLQAQDNRYEMARTLEQLHRLATAEGNGAQARRYAEQATALLVALNVRHPSC